MDWNFSSWLAANTPNHTIDYRKFVVAGSRRSPLWGSLFPSLPSPPKPVLSPREIVRGRHRVNRKPEPVRFDVVGFCIGFVGVAGELRVDFAENGAARSG